MAKEPEATTPIEDEWEAVTVGLGEEWDFDKKGDLIGVILQARFVDLPEHSQTNQDGKVRDKAQVWEFLLPETGETVFLWGSYQLDEALTDFGSGDTVKVHFDGYKKFDSKSGPRQVKMYKVFKKKA